MKDWDDMRYFHAVAEGGSLSAASRLLGVNHSTVFRRMNQLEERLQARLFDRLDNRYQLTDSGRQLLTHIRQVANVMDEVERQVVGRDTLLEGSIRVTCPDTFLDWVVPEVVAAFCRRYPRITIELRAEQERLDLARREADVALRATNAPPDYLVGKRLGQMGWSFYAHPALGAVAATLPASDPAPLIAPEGKLLQVPACQWLDKQLSRFQVTARAGSLRAAAALAKQGLGLALLPAEAGEGLVRVAEPLRNFDTGIWILYHPDMRQNARLNCFVQLAAEAVEGALRDGVN
ncbi:LysR family transcriptional regulator [Litorivivens sp.]|uniref:LysR family transcriptional regulator n=1 Tax=Litorivivens sp. TaxID=2020868 RepID=UPI00356396CA